MLIKWEDTQLRELVRSIGFHDHFFNELAGNAWTEICRRIVASMLYTLRIWKTHPHTNVHRWLIESYDANCGELRWQWHDGFPLRVLSDEWVGLVPEDIVEFGHNADGGDADGDDDDGDFVSRYDDHHDDSLLQDVETTDAVETEEEGEEQEDNKSAEGDDGEDGAMEPGLTPSQPGSSHSPLNRWELDEITDIAVGNGQQQQQRQQQQEHLPLQHLEEDVADI